MLTGLQKSVLIAGLGLLAGGSGLMIYDRFRPAYRVEPDSSYKTLDPSKLSQPEKDALVEIREAEEYLRQNSKKSAREAMVLFNRVLSRDLNQSINQLSRFGLGVALERLDDQSAALVHYRELKKQGIMDPTLAARVDYRLGKVLLEINHEEEGRSLLERTLSTTDDNNLKSDIHAAYGNYFMSRGDRKRAVENYTIALKYNPDNLNAELRRAQATRKRGKYRQAYEYYDDFLVGAANLDPSKKSKVVKNLRSKAYEQGIIAYRSEKYSEAITHFNKVITSYPDSAYTEKSYYWMGESYEHLGNSDMAINMYNRALKNENDSMDQPALIKKGIILHSKGKLEEALISFKKASEDYPGGDFTDRAIEWKNETVAQIKENSILESYSLENNYFN